MASIPLMGSSLAVVKKALREALPDVRSSHLSEALAASLRRRTHASLIAELPGYRDDPPIELLVDELFDRRLQELGYPPDPEFSFEWLNNSGAIPTLAPNAWDIDYRSVREKAWRNLMVCVINEGLRQKLFSLRPDNNRWPNAENDGCVFDFTLRNGLPARGYVHDIGFGELSIHAAVNPISDWVRCGNAGFDAGDAFAAGWLERQEGAWLQSATNLFNCRKVLVTSLAGLEAEPLGYGDRGGVR
jgi:hypothetical protein